MLPISVKEIVHSVINKDKYESALFETVILILFQLSIEFHAEKLKKQGKLLFSTESNLDPCRKTPEPPPTYSLSKMFC